MAYISGFKYDIFISYAHVDNTTYANKNPWMSEFFEALKTLLDKRIGRKDSSSIWWDRKLKGNEFFDDTIKQAIERSALFITFGSNGYYESDYCKQELTWFYTCSAKSPVGLRINNCGRIFNVLINKKGYKDWPSECQGLNPYEMYKVEREDSPGSPLECHSDDFSTKMGELVDDIFNTLQLIKKLPPADASKVVQAEVQPAAVKPKVFVARTTDTLRKEKNQIITALEEAGMDVFFKKEIPPPYARAEHEQTVRNILADTFLSIHLFDDVPGDLIENDKPDTFSQEQAIISKELKKNQLIFIPRDLNFEEIEDLHHQAFLEDLQNRKDEGDNYSLIREFAVPNILYEIKVKLDKSMKKASRARNGGDMHSVLLDFHDKDAAYAGEMAKLLVMYNVNTLLTKFRSADPKECIDNYRAQLMKASSLIVICGKDKQDWAKERLYMANETFMREEGNPPLCAVYLAPQVQSETPLIKRSFLEIEYLDDRNSPNFNPGTVEPFIKKIA